MTPIEKNAIVAQIVFKRKLLDGTILLTEGRELVPHYSTDWHAAWQIFKNIDELPDDIWDAKIRKQIFWKALGITDYLNPDALVVAWKQVVSWTPKLVCRAALKAYGVKSDCT
jgi:hypothetical protein